MLNYWNNYDQSLLNCFYSITSPTRSLQVIPVIQQRPQRCTTNFAKGSRDDDFLGARASRPHKAWRSLGDLSHFDRLGTAPWLPLRLADGVAAGRVAACSLDGQGGGQTHLRSGAPWRRTPFKRAGCGRPGIGRRNVCRDRMRAGRPRSQAMTPGCAVGRRLLKNPTCTPSRSKSGLEPPQGLG